MIEVLPGLFVGSETDEQAIRGQEHWYVISAAKEPYHRQTLHYVGRSAPKDDPEYLIAYRDGRLILNLVDVPDPKYISEEVINAALEAIELNRGSKYDVLVHCNQGHSRGPTIAFLYMHKVGALPDDFELALEHFATIYTDFAPATGMLEYARAHW